MKTKHLFLIISFIFLVASGGYLIDYVWSVDISDYEQIVNKTSLWLLIISILVFVGTLYFGVKTKKYKKIYAWFNKPLNGKD